jgi:Ca2+-binding EF-hand superfamily protein
MLARLAVMLLVFGTGAHANDENDLDPEYAKELEDSRPDVDAEFAKDPHGYNADRDMLGFQENDDTESNNAAFKKGGYKGEDDVMHEVESEESVLARFEVHFKEMDKNNDNRLDWHELDTHLREAMVKRFKHKGEESKNEAHEKHIEWDTDGDGHVTLKEYVAEEIRKHEAELDGTIHMTPQGGNAAKEEEEARTASITAHATGMFNFADENKNGKVDGKEFHVLLHPMHSEREQEYEVFKASNYIKHFDKNDDSALSLDELVMYDVPHAKTILAEWDTNKDGKLDKHEVQALQFAPISDDGNGATHVQEIEDELIYIMSTLADDQKTSHHENIEQKTISFENAKLNMFFFVHALDREAKHRAQTEL